MSNRILMISVHPRYARKIFLGEKNVELRKSKPQIKKGDQILVYVSSPEKSLQGVLVTKEIISDTPSELWEKVKLDAGISLTEFSDYYHGSKKGYGIYFDVEKKFSQPVKLCELRDLISNFHPPQSYRYFSVDDLVHYENQLKIEF